MYEPLNKDYQLIDRAEDLKALREELSKASLLAIDIESNGYYHYFERTCILTVSTEERTFIIDSIKLWEHMGSLKALFSDPDRLVLFHAGGYDVASLKRDFSYTFANVFDSLEAAKLLGHESLGLASLVEHYCGVKLPKELQRYNWSRRPLCEEHMAYLIGDTCYLFRLKTLLMEELEAKDLLEEFAIGCEQLKAVSAGKPPNTNAFWRLKGIKSLTNSERGALKALWEVRDKLAQKYDKAPFRILSNSLLLKLVQKKPASLDQLFGTKELSSQIFEKHGSEFIEAVEVGLANPCDMSLRPKPKRKDAESAFRPTLPKHLHAQRQALKKLKSWRLDEAERREIGIQGVLPTPVLKQIAYGLPVNIDEISKIPDFGQRRLERYADVIITFIQDIELTLK